MVPWRPLAIALVAIGLLTSSWVWAADSVPSSPIDTRNSADDNAELPPGHPPIDPTADDTTAAPDSEESAAAGTQLARDRISRLNSVPIGTIEVHVLNEENRPVPGAAVIMQLHRESVSEGNSDTQRELLTDVGGAVRFEHLATDSAFSYHIMLIAVA